MTDFAARLATQLDRRARLVLAIILVLVAEAAVLRALNRTFWYDEVFTAILARQPSFQVARDALLQAVDTNPPAFHLAARIGQTLVGDDHLGCRLTGVLGILMILAAVYLILERRVDRLSALTGSVFVMCTVLPAYSYEARPYAFMLGWISLAVLCWQRASTRPLYPWLLALSLALAASLHYYAILIFPAFGLAEAAVLWRARRFRLPVWLALAAGALPMLWLSPYLLALRQAFGSHNWAHPTPFLMFSTYQWLFTFGSAWGWTFAVGIAVLFIRWHLLAAWRRGIEGAMDLAEAVLVFTLLAFPAIAVPAAMLAHGGMAPRYMMVVLVGAALVVGYLAPRLPAGVRLLLLFLLIMDGAMYMGSELLPVALDGVKGARQNAAGEVAAYRKAANQADLPMVVSSGFQYLPMAYYTPPELARNVYQLMDAPGAVQYTGTDSIDLALIILKRYFPLQTPDYQDFFAAHREFLLVANGDSWDWWPRRLRHDGHTLELLAIEGRTSVYKVTLKP